MEVGKPFAVTINSHENDESVESMDEQISFSENLWGSIDAIKENTK